MTTVVKFDRVNKTFPGGGKRADVNALVDIDLEIAKGSIVGIIGYSGAGKSTLVRLINGLEKPSSGTVEVLGVNVHNASETQLRTLRSKIGMIFQQFNLFNARTVRGNVAYPLKVAGWEKPEIRARVDELLDFVSIREKADQYPRKLSGGQKQRVGIARAIATNPEILLADEATSALDPHTTREVLDLLRSINRTFGITIVVITHQISIVQKICDQVVVMDDGAVVDSGPTHEIFARPKAELTKQLVDSVTQGVPEGEALEALLADPGTILSVDINEFGTEQVSEVLAKYGVERSVVYGGITSVMGRQIGTLTYRVRGEARRIDGAVEELNRHTNAQVLGVGGAVPVDSSHARQTDAIDAQEGEQR